MPHEGLKALTSIAEQHRISAMYAFGSRASEVAAWANGEIAEIENVESDVDIGILMRHKAVPSVKEKVNLAIDIEDLLGVSRLDLVVINEVNPFLALDIIKGELIFCDELDAQAEYELYVMRRAGDLAYYEHERRRQILQRPSK